MHSVSVFIDEEKPRTAAFITPGENLSELLEIATSFRFCPKFLENHRAMNLEKILRGLVGWDAKPRSLGGPRVSKLSPTVPWFRSRGLRLVVGC